MKIAIYSRKSVFTGKGESIENQIEMCRNYISFHLPDAKCEDIFIYEDEGFSAKDLKRPQFMKMMDDLEDIKFDYIICYRLDRLSRNVSDFSHFVEILEKKGVGLICIKEHFDTSTPMGRAMMYITSVFAQLERETLAERVRDNMHMLARTGRYLGGPAPTGYESAGISEIIIDGKIKTSHILKVNEDEIGVVKTMFEKYLEMHSVSAVGRHLALCGIKSKITGKQFSNLGIRDILKNPVYCIADKAAYTYFRKMDADICNEKSEWNGKYGIAAYNKRDHAKGKSRRNDISQWIIAIGRHKGIVSGKDWVSIQNYMHSHSDEKIINTSKLGLLSGLIYCTKCGEKMFAKRHNSNSEKYSYICSSKLRKTAKVCNAINLIGYETDEIITDCIKSYLSKPEDFEKLSLFNKRNVIRTLVKKIEWDGANLNIHIYSFQS